MSGATSRLELKVVPGASRAGIAGWLGDKLKIRVSAPPERGRANAAVLELLAGALGIPEERVRIVAGTSSARKVVEIDGLGLYVLHDVNELDLDPRTAGFRAVITGHSHRPRTEERDGVLFLNPGSAGPRRFTLPVTLARLRVRGHDLAASIVHLDPVERPR